MRKHYLVLHFAILCISGAAVFAKLIPLSAELITCMRAGIASVALLIYILLKQEKISLPTLAIAKHKIFLIPL